jgi:hypothetical protein
MVALQGTLETFSLPDVLQLLSSTKKTGCLRVSGDSGEGSVWVRDGAIVAGQSLGAASAPAVDVVFELLRFDSGEFVFDDGGEPSDAGEPAEVAAVLADAERMVDEWREIESVVPSSAHFVTLVAELSGDDVTLDKDRWRAVVTVAGGVSVASLGDQLGLADLAVARLVKDLAESGLVEVGPPQSQPEPRVAPEPERAPQRMREPEAEAPSMPAARDHDGFEPFDRDALVIDQDEPAPSSSPAFSVVADELVDERPVSPVMDEAPPPAPEPAAVRDDLMPITPEPGEAAEIARQLANLSPKAARAVAAAAKASTPEEREAALAEVEASDEQINRELLLKFLGTVN